MNTQSAADGHHRLKQRFLLLISITFILTGLFFNSPLEILQGFLRINTHPSLLLSDYLVIGGIGATLLNSALIILIELAIIHYTQTRITGALLAAVLTTAGFAFFGTNVFNSLPIIAGALLTAKLEKLPINSYFLPAFFGTSLGPLVSYIAFGLSLPFGFSVPAGLLAGLAAGMIVPPLSSAFLRFHQGYNLYNVGFTAGIIGMVAVAVLRMLNVQVLPLSILDTEHEFILTLLTALMFLALLGLGLVLNGWKLSGLTEIWKDSGRLISDFVIQVGSGPALINMGLVGLISLGYVKLMRGPINGPVIGALLTLCGFAAFGKHPRNCIPILMGTYLASLFHLEQTNSTGAMLTALFGTTLAPIAGRFGVLAGVLAGYLHTALVANVLPLHGGVNLYNNGFSGGFVAGFLVPLLEAAQRFFEREKNDKPA